MTSDDEMPTLSPQVHLINRDSDSEDEFYGQGGTQTPKLNKSDGIQTQNLQVVGGATAADVTALKESEKDVHNGTNISDPRGQNVRNESENKVSETEMGSGARPKDKLPGKPDTAHKPQMREVTQNILRLEEPEFRAQLMGWLADITNTQHTHTNTLAQLNRENELMLDRFTAFQERVEQDSDRLAALAQANNRSQGCVKKLESEISKVQGVQQSRNWLEMKKCIEDAKREIGQVSDHVQTLLTDFASIKVEHAHFKDALPTIEEALFRSVNPEDMRNAVQLVERKLEKRISSAWDKLNEVSNQVFQMQSAQGTPLAHDVQSSGLADLDYEGANDPMGKEDSKPGYVLRSNVPLSLHPSRKPKCKTGGRNSSQVNHSYKSEFQGNAPQNDSLGLLSQPHRGMSDYPMNQNGRQLGNSMPNTSSMGGMPGQPPMPAFNQNANQFGYSMDGQNYSNMPGLSNMPVGNSNGFPTGNYNANPMGGHPSGGMPAYSIAPHHNPNGHVSGRQNDPNLPRNIGKDLPKLERFSGDGSCGWDDFIEQFETYAYLKGWQLDASILRMYLSGKALEHYNRQTRDVKMSYEESSRALRKRFESDCPKEAVQSLFQTMRQKTDEPIRDYADRVRKTARLAFSDLRDAEAYIEKEMIQTFLKGLLVLDLGLYGLGQKYQDFDSCVDDILVFRENKRSILQHKHVRLAETSQEIEQEREFEVYRTQFRTSSSSNSAPNSNTNASLISSLTQAVAQMSENLKEFQKPMFSQAQLSESLKSTLQQLLPKGGSTPPTANQQPMLSEAQLSESLKSALQQLLPSGGSTPTSVGQGRNSRGTSRSRSNSGERNKNCFTCNEPGHFARDCPKKDLKDSEKA